MAAPSLDGSIVVLGGACSRHPDHGESLEALIARTVRDLLNDSGARLGEVDAVVALGNEQVDGGISTLLLSEAAGSFGRSYLLVSGSSGAAVDAAVSLIRSGAARSVLVVGWGQMTKRCVDDLSPISSDPLFHQPLGVGARELSDLHIGQLVADGQVDAREASRYATTMKGRRRRSFSLSRTRIVRGRNAGSTIAHGGPRRHEPDRVDRATALLFRASGAGPAPEQRTARIVLTDLVRGGSGAGWTGFDPRQWRNRLPDELQRKARSAHFVELAAPNAHVELAVLSGLGMRASWEERAGLNREGGGLAGSSGASDGLARIERVFAGLDAATRRSAHGIVIELSGALGQSVSLFRFAREAPAR
jgi:hypothetical protein